MGPWYPRTGDNRGMPSVRAYGSRHVENRQQALAWLAMNAGHPCRDCGKPMDVSQALDLCHETQEDKRAGRPGTFLMHAACNRREFAIPPQVRGRQQDAASAEAARLARLGLVPRADGCYHQAEWFRAPQVPGACQCAQPAAHHEALAAEARSAQKVVTVSHNGAPCPACGGYSGSRIW